MKFKNFQDVLLSLCMIVSWATVFAESPPIITKQVPTYEILFQVSPSQHERPKPFILECEAYGYPSLKYVWTKNNREFNWTHYKDRIFQQPRRGTLVFAIPHDEDVGQYQCFASNALGNATSNSVFVRKSILESFASEEVRVLHHDEGKPLEIPCKVPGGHPKPQITWLREDNLGALKKINSSRITVSPNGSLCFSNVTRQDNSSDFLYVCAAFSSFRNEYKLGNRIQLSVTPSSSSQNEHMVTLQSPPSRNTEALRGNDVELWCIFGGTPLPEIKWSGKASTISSNRVVYANYNRTLRILNVDDSDAGRYDCVATNGVGNPVSSFVTLSVVVAPYFTLKPTIQNAAEGEAVEFRCQASGRPSPDITWIYNGIPLGLAQFNPRRTVEVNKIVLNNLQEEDTGNYGCNASNPYGYVYKDAYVNVQNERANITTSPADVTTVDGKSVTLHCRSFGKPKPTMSWTRDDQELNNDTGRFRITNGDLEISSVTADDSGHYKCRARNFGLDYKTARLEVKEHTRIINGPEDSEVAAEDIYDKICTVIFNCSVIADPTLNLSISWLRDNTPIDFETEKRYIQVQNESLTITDAEESDSGVYTCVARTELDEARAEATFAVQNKPDPPEILTLSCDSMYARIYWKPKGDNWSPIVAYKIQFQDSYDPDSWYEAASILAPYTSSNVSIIPGPIYSFRVVAINTIGNSTPSHSKSCNISLDVPFENPKNVKSVSNRPNNLIISWTPMEAIYHNGPGFYYVVKWRLNDNSDNWTRVVVKDWRERKFLVNNTPTYQPYRITVWAGNELGEAQAAPTEIVGYSGEGKPLQAPENLIKVLSEVNQTIEVSWSPVSTESVQGVLKGYKVRRWTCDNNNVDNDVEKIVNSQNDTSADIEDLPFYSKNYIGVLAYNSYSDGPKSTIEVITGEGVPGPVKDFEAYALGTRAIYLSWEKPDIPNGVITGYEIAYEESSASDDSHLDEEIEPTTVKISQSRTTAKLAGLKLGTEYKIEIYAKTMKGAGAGENINMTTDDETALRIAPPDFSLSQMQSDNNETVTVRVTWLPNFEEEGKPGSNFYVEYKRTDATVYNRTAEESNENYYDIRDLQLGKNYIFKVYAVEGSVQNVSKTKEIKTQRTTIINEFSGYHQVQLLHSSESSSCSGSIIEADLILIAANCVYRFRNAVESITIRTSNNNLASGGQQTKNIEHVFIHTGFEFGMPQHDIALLVLKTNLSFSSYVNKIMLPNASNTISGIGQLQLVNESSRILHSVDATLFNDNECHQKVNPVVHEMFPNETLPMGLIICARANESLEIVRRSSSCHGDSTLTCSSGPNKFLCGLEISSTLRSKTCGLCGFPRIFINVGYYSEWISDTRYKHIGLTNGCKKNHLRCRNDQCVSANYLCDGTNDCGDNSDEDPDVCALYRATDRKVWKERGQMQSCNYDSTNRQKHIPTENVCDGIVHCPNPNGKSEEENCPTCNSKHAFHCRLSNQCILRSDTCNGKCHCNKCEEEMDCSSCKNITSCENADSCNTTLDQSSCTNCTTETSFHCTKMMTCISDTSRCDRKNDCVFNEDEAACFFCTNNNKRIKLESQCDGIPDCSDGDPSIRSDDEENCKSCYKGTELCNGACVSPGTCTEQPNTMYIIIGSVVGAIIIVIATTIVIYRFFRKRRLSRRVSQRAANNEYDGMVDPADGNVLFNHLEIDSAYNIFKDDVKIEDVKLGEGQFGLVRRGIFKDDTVAVKTLKRNTDKEYYTAFLKEIKVMATVGRPGHDNVVWFHGVIADKLNADDLAVVIEFSPHGNLHGYLRKYAKQQQPVNAVQNLYSMLTSTRRGSESDKINLNESVMVSFCKQIANGMQFLSDCGIIHGDLAARNVLVFNENVVKLTDFGLSTKLYECPNYTRKRKVLCPWRWMAPESLRYMEFSANSDVWSFGVVIWEIYTYAEVPFPADSYTSRFIDELERGLRLTKPQAASDIIYAMMMKCWDLRAECRPSFENCTAFFLHLETQAIARDNE